MKYDKLMREELEKWIDAYVWGKGKREKWESRKVTMEHEELQVVVA